MCSIFQKYRDCYGMERERRNLQRIAGIQKKRPPVRKEKPYVPPVRERISKRDVRYVPPCNLPCVTGKSTLIKQDKYAQDVLEFEGNAKITLVDPTPLDSYNMNRLAAALYALSFIVMGVLIMALLSLVMQFKFYYMINIHIMACAVGLHMMIPTAYMIQEKYAMPAVYFQDQGRRCQAVLLRVIGLFWVGMSYYILFMDTIFMDNPFHTLHGITGFVSFWTALAELFIQFYPRLQQQRFPIIVQVLRSAQIAFKIISMFFAALCFAVVLSRPMIKNLWPNKHLFILLIAMVIFISFVANLGLQLRLLSELYAYFHFLRIKRLNRNRPPCARPIPV